jgi:transposase
MSDELENLSREELIILVKQLLSKISELEVRLRRNSSNSSTPPSANPYKKPQSLRQRSGKKAGGQFNHQGHGFSLPHSPDQTITLKADKCRCCGTDLQGSPYDVVEKRYKIDYQVRTFVFGYEQTAVKCPTCGSNTLSTFPSNVTATKQYGENVDAVVVLLNQYGNVSISKTAKLISNFLSIPISTGAVNGIVTRCAVNSLWTLEYIANSLKQSKILNVDETGVRVEGKNYWLHTASNSIFTYNTVSHKRGIEGTNANGVLKDFQGIAVHDCLKQYWSYENCRHALCGAHLLRELIGIMENDGFQWAYQMKELLEEVKIVVDRYKTEKQAELSKYHLEEFFDKYHKILELGELECPVVETRKQSKARNLLDRFIAFEPEITRFVVDFNVPFDNNQAERDIRNAKVKMKVSGGFRSIGGAVAFAKIGSVIGSATKQSKSLLQTIKALFLTPNSNVFATE